MSELSDFNQGVISEFRAHQGKVGGQLATMPVLLLTMTGAKSGRTLTRPLVYTTDGDRIVVIASFAGAPKSPAWYHNLGLIQPVNGYKLDDTPSASTNDPRAACRWKSVWRGRRRKALACG